MATVDFRVETAWNGTLEEDLEKFVAELPPVLIRAMTMIGEDMKESLRRDIEEKVYSVYSPEEYERRSENPSLGIPLSSMEGNAHVYEPRAEARGVEVRGLLNFTYKPSGEHANPEVNPSPLSGDALIQRIESGAGYATRFHQARPFWTPFVEEMIEGGALASAFDRELMLAGFELSETSTVTREAGDGELHY